MKLTENNRERNALVLSISLGIISGLLTVASFYAAGITFLFFSVLNPVILTFVAPHRSTALSILANLVLVLSLPVIVLLVLWVLRVPWTGLPRGGYGELGAGFLLALVVAITVAWTTSTLVKFVRSKLGPRDNPNPDTLA